MTCFTKNTPKFLIKYMSKITIKKENSGKRNTLTKKNSDNENFDKRNRK